MADYPPGTKVLLKCTVIDTFMHREGPDAHLVPAYSLLIGDGLTTPEQQTCARASDLILASDVLDQSGFVFGNPAEVPAQP
jgi:hypothetical protein